MEYREIQLLTVHKLPNAFIKSTRSFSKFQIPYSKFLIILLITAWIFAGWPQIFNPSTLFRTGFPPKIQEA